jgi:hypothetical protein
MENIFGWRSQYDRMKRWSGKLSVVEDLDDQERLDLCLAFFLNCYALRDWFIKSGAFDAGTLDKLIAASESMRICRDVCNRSKHLRLERRPSTEVDFSIVREYTPRGNIFSVLFLGRKRQLSDVADACTRFWEEFVETHNPVEPKTPFHDTRARDAG